MPRTIQQSFLGGVISPKMRGQTGSDVYKNGLADSLNFIVDKLGPVTRRGGTKYLGDETVAYLPNTKHDLKLLAFNSSTLELIVVVGNKRMTFYTTEGPYVVDDAPAYSVGSYDTGEVVLYSDEFYISEVDANVNTPGGAGWLLLTDGILTVNYTAMNIGEDDIVSGVMIGDTLYWCYSTDGFIRKLSFTFTSGKLVQVNYKGNDNVYDDASKYGGSPINLAVTLGGTGDYEYSYAVTAETATYETYPTYGSDTGGQLTISNTCVLTWDTPIVGVIRYNIYRRVGQGYLYIGSTTNTTFTDNNIVPDESASARDGYLLNGDTIVSYYQQRLVRAVTNELVLSVTGQPEDSRYGIPLLATDAINLKLLNSSTIMSIVPSRNLLIVTDSGEFVLTPGNDNGLTPTSYNLVQISGYGGANVKAKLFQNNAIFVHANRRDIIMVDTIEQTSVVITSHAEHFFKNTRIVSMCSQDSRDLLWVVLEDGTVLSATIQPGKFVAWAKHAINSNGAVITDCETFRSGGEDIVFFLAKENVGLDTDAYRILKLNDNISDDFKQSYYLDFGNTQIEGTPVTSITVPDRFEGLEVTVVADGFVYNNITVTDNIIELPELEPACNTFHYGLKYTSSLTTLDVDAIAQQTIIGKHKQIDRVSLILRESRAGKVGTDTDHLSPLPDQTNDDYDFELYSGQTEAMCVSSERGLSGRLVFVQDEPLPSTVCAIVSDGEVF